MPARTSWAARAATGDHSRGVRSQRRSMRVSFPFELAARPDVTRGAGLDGTRSALTGRLPPAYWRVGPRSSAGGDEDDPEQGEGDAELPEARQPLAEHHA